MRVNYLSPLSALLYSSVFVAGAVAMTADEIAERETVKGYVETVKLYPGNLALDGRLDTGAQTTSLNAPDIETFERNEQTWVRFTVANDSEKIVFERPVVREVSIKAASADELQKRYVVILGVCAGETFREVEVNLADRTHMTYQLLVGRNFLKENATVTSSERQLHEPNCEIPDSYL